eukprot:SM000222S06999  [mRNA]  locus=s222:89160:93034:- [translate_table: standard]
MDAPDEDPDSTESQTQYVNNITIPSALLAKNTTDAIKTALRKDVVHVSLDWTEALPHPDNRVEYELWTNSNDECGQKCDMQIQFVRDFKGVAQVLEEGNYTLFTPHYITWYCPQTYTDSKQCQSQCINKGRYCAPDPEQDFEKGYDGKDVVIENLRQLCFFKAAQEINRPWLWWDYVTDFQMRCPMSKKLYNQECAETVIKALGIDIDSVRTCMGDVTKDEDNKILKAEQDNQVGDGERGDVTILPTIVINRKQYRGKLDKTTVQKAICSGFEETTDPPVCLGADIQTNECKENNGGCWSGFGKTACKDTFRGKVCVCPTDKETGTVFIGDGYTSCEPAGPGRCKIDNGGCWNDTHDGNYFTACDEVNGGTGCKCPKGFTGNGKDCEDIDECKPNTGVCKCSDCRCKNTYGSYKCTCASGGVYLEQHDKCISDKAGGSSTFGWFWSIILVACLAVVAVGGYVLYKYRLRTYMDSEIRAIMAQYMPLDSQNETATAARQPLNEEA